MFEILQLEFNAGWLNADQIKAYIGYGSITEDQYNSIVNPQAVQSSASAQSVAPASSAPASSESAQSSTPDSQQAAPSSAS